MTKDNPTRWRGRLGFCGCWVRAVGAIPLISSFWLFAHLHNLRAQRLEDSRVNIQIGLIGSTAWQFDSLVQQYIKLALAKDSQAANYYHGQIDDPRIERMIDFNVMPISHWPSMEVHRAFNEYFFSSIMLMETSADEDTSIKLQDRIVAYGRKFEVLKKSLDASRR